MFLFTMTAWKQNLEVLQKIWFWYFIRLQYGLFAIFQASEKMFPIFWAREIRESQNEYMMIYE